MGNEPRFMVASYIIDKDRYEDGVYCVLNMLTLQYVLANGGVFKTYDRSEADSLCARLNRKISDS